jgi:hypothetical protein
MFVMQNSFSFMSIYITIEVKSRQRVGKRMQVPSFSYARMRLFCSDRPNFSNKTILSCKTVKAKVLQQNSMN